MEIQEAVAAGSEYLDHDDPQWFLRVDLDRLDMGSGVYCLLGQLDGAYGTLPQGDYFHYRAVRDLDQAWVCDHGFIAPLAAPLGWRTHSRALTEAWAALIRQRRGEGAQS